MAIFVHIHVHVDLTITTEKLIELFATMKDNELDILGFWLGLPETKRDDVDRNFHSPSQRRDAYLDLYATDHPCPSWKRVVEILRFGVHLSCQADMVKNTYVEGRIPHFLEFSLHFQANHPNKCSP